MIRPGEPRDEESLARLRSALWPDEEPDEGRAAARALLSGLPPGLLPAAVFVAEAGDEVVGFVEVGLRSFADGCAADRAVGFVEGWYVAPGHRGKGMGRALVDAAQVWCREQGCREIGSDTWIDHDASQRAHEALGFEVVDRCVNFRKALGTETETEDDALYGADLAAVHHAYFGEVARAAAGELLARLAAAGIASGRVVDLAAGSGILSRRMVDAGFEAFGVDQSAAMLRLARAVVPEATLVRDSLWSASLPGGPGGLVAVAAVGEAFSYAAEPAAGPSGLRGRLASIHRSLAPGGLVLFDVAGPGRSGPAGVRERCFRCGGGLLRLEEREDRAAGTLVREITTFTPFGRLYRRTDETHRLTLYDPERVEALLADAGFAWQRLSRYGETEFHPGWHGFAAWKTV